MKRSMMKIVMSLIAKQKEKRQANCILTEENLQENIEKTSLRVKV